MRGARRAPRNAPGVDHGAQLTGRAGVSHNTLRASVTLHYATEARSRVSRAHASESFLSPCQCGGYFRSVLFKCKRHSRERDATSLRSANDSTAVKAASAHHFYAMGKCVS